MVGQHDPARALNHGRPQMSEAVNAVALDAVDALRHAVLKLHLRPHLLERERGSLVREPFHKVRFDGHDLRAKEVDDLDAALHRRFVWNVVQFSLIETHILMCGLVQW